MLGWSKTRVWASDIKIPPRTPPTTAPSSTSHWGSTSCTYEIASARLVGHYYPYGKEKGTGNPASGEKFTGYFRDSETGLDYADDDQNYYGPGTGRYISPLIVRRPSPSNPGSWNKYPYEGQDPINNVSGLEGPGPNDPIGLPDPIPLPTGPGGRDEGEQGGETPEFKAMVFQGQVRDAKSLAHSRLLRPDCLQAVFAGANGVGPDSPAAFLDQIPVIQKFLADSDTTATPGQTPVLSADPNEPSTVIDVIYINSNPASQWTAGFMDDFHIGENTVSPSDPGYANFYRAMTLVHEIAHIWATNKGLQNGFELLDNPDLQGLTPAQALAAAQQQITNQSLIYNKCFKQ